MLVLTRRQSESIIIANNIKITVVSVGPGRVKLGIEAPPHVRVDRKEIHDKIEQSSDVLAAVGGGTASTDPQNTLVATGSDTALIVTNPPEAVAIAEPQEDEKPSEAGTPPLPLNPISKFRPPRKPR